MVVPGDQYISENHMLVQITTTTSSAQGGKGAKGKGKCKGGSNGHDSAAVAVSIKDVSKNGVWVGGDRIGSDWTTVTVGSTEILLGETIVRLDLAPVSDQVPTAKSKRQRK